MAKDEIVDASSDASSEDDSHKEIEEEHGSFFDVSQSAEDGAINALLALKITPISTSAQHSPEELPPLGNNQPRREHNLAELFDDLKPIDPSENDRSNQTEIGAEHGGSSDGVLQSAEDSMINAMSALNITPDDSTRDEHPHAQKESTLQSNNQPTREYKFPFVDDDEPTDPSRVIPNAAYDPKFEEMGLPIDPHLRAMMLFNFDAKPLPRSNGKETASKDLKD